MSYLDVPPKASMLYALRPPSGGNTLHHVWRLRGSVPLEGPHRRPEDQARRHLQQRWLCALGVTPTDDPLTSRCIHRWSAGIRHRSAHALSPGRRRNAYLVGLALAESEALLNEL
jgi:taurine dioxygenase